MRARRQPHRSVGPAPRGPDAGRGARRKRNKRKAPRGPRPGVASFASFASFAGRMGLRCAPMARSRRRRTSPATRPRPGDRPRRSGSLGRAGAKKRTWVTPCALFPELRRGDPAVEDHLAALDVQPQREVAHERARPRARPSGSAPARRRPGVSRARRGGRPWTASPRGGLLALWTDQPSLGEWECSARSRRQWQGNR